MCQLRAAEARALRRLRRCSASRGEGRLSDDDTSDEGLLAAFAGARFTFDRGRVACPSCGAAYDAACDDACGLRGLSRLRQPCPTCEGDARICGCRDGGVAREEA